ncbi:hypothetical protein [Paraeggerthella sp. Marseille-Q4926]|uniref:plasmid mobilization protein n=1 Tax=Paraeggerthella sp. Marseille-Q4926 TaxID=2866587 RepID=UPI001CE4671A|nr:hypothetical protein [Paraeggerthella sp. Marseille-Q4926]
MSERNNDRSGRWRNKTIAFRVSQEEAAQLDMLVSISGLTKQDYITSKLLNREVSVIPSSRIQLNLQSTMRQLLDRLSSADQAALTQEVQESIVTLIDVLASLGEKSKPSAKDPLLHLTADEAFRAIRTMDSKSTEANIGGDAQ